MNEEILKEYEEIGIKLNRGEAISSKWFIRVYNTIMTDKYKYSNCVPCMKRAYLTLKNHVDAYKMASLMVDSQIVDSEPFKKIKKVKNEKK